MATKAAERARAVAIILARKIADEQNARWGTDIVYDPTLEEGPSVVGVTSLITEALAAYEAATIERCAQIADEPYSDSVQAFGGDEPKAVGTKIAAAIRPMGDADGDDK